MTSLAPHMEAFLREHLVRHRGASQHTCDSYAYSFQSLFEFAAGRRKVAPSALMLEQLDATLVSGFLQHLETTRGNSAETRNIRLAAIRAFFRFLQHREPAALDQIRRVLAIPFKRRDTRLVPYLTKEEVQALVNAPTPTTRQGLRDRAMLHLTICAGLRVSEFTVRIAAGAPKRNESASIAPTGLRSPSGIGPVGTRLARHPGSRSAAPRPRARSSVRAVGADCGRRDCSDQRAPRAAAAGRCRRRSSLS